MKSSGFFLNDRLTASQIENFKLFENEDLIFATREHWLPLIIRLVRTLIVSLFIAVILSSAAILILNDILLSVSVFLLILLIGSILSVRELIHWSFHLYVATSKQIIEVHYNPLFSEAINSVLLDQIRCTEIDVEMFGIIPEIIGIGNVTLTFDRPTHKEEFVIKDIRSPRKIANLLSGQIHQNPQVRSQQARALLWAKELKTNKYRFLGEAGYGFNTN